MLHHVPVDLRGVVDLLSHHRHAGPRVHARELLGNATRTDCPTPPRPEGKGFLGGIQ